MKQLLFVVMMACAVSVNAQDLKKVSTPYVIGKKTDAKTEIDKIMNDAKAQNKADAWFWKATVYASLFDDPQLSAAYPDAAEIALAAFKKYTELDPAYKVMNADEFANKAVIDFLYRGFLSQGITYFDKKDWENAHKYFALSAEIGDLITATNWKNNKQPIDTTTVLFSGYAAQNAKKVDEAAKYYARIADQRITNSPAAGDLKDIYEYLASHYMQTKNNEMFYKYIALAKELYPRTLDLWVDYETEFADKNFGLAEKAAAYDKADAAGTLTANQYLSYGNMFYNIKDEEKEKMDEATVISYRDKAAEAFIKGYQKDNLNGLSAFNAGLVNYNEWAILDDEVAANRRKIRELNQGKSTDKDPKKRAAADAKIKTEVDIIQKKNIELEKQQAVFAEKAIEWTNVAYNVLSGKENLDRIEKNVLGKSVDYLANLYLWKRERAKGNNAEYDKFDALYKKFDALHGKL